MEKIIEYIKQRYEPLSIIIYGSYADASNNENSDFDALVISKSHKEYHDVSFINGIQLDVFIYPYTYFDNEIDCEDFIQIFDSKIIMDTYEYGKLLKNLVLQYINNIPSKSRNEIESELEWCNKMLLRTKRNDEEGMFRWHLMLTDSLEIFCDVMNCHYFGPKKSLKWMKKQYPEAFECYANALFNLNATAIENWITYLNNIF